MTRSAAAAIAIVAAALAVGGCGRPADPPGTLVADDRRQLDEAATMLDANGMRPLSPANESIPR